MIEKTLEEKNNNGKATASLILGIIGLMDWLLNILVLPFYIVGLILGILALKSTKKGRAKAGIIMNIIGLLLCITTIIIGLIVYVNYKKQL